MHGLVLVLVPVPGSLVPHRCSTGNLLCTLHTLVSRTVKHGGYRVVILSCLQAPIRQAEEVAAMLASLPDRLAALPLTAAQELSR